MKIFYTEHAQMRMRQRDILPEEVEEVLSRPSSVHRKGTSPYKREASNRIGDKNITVVYEESDIVTVITVF